jgi:hypothetical protein
MASVSKRKGYLEAERLASDVTDSPFGAGIAPGPPEAVVQERKRVIRSHVAECFGVVGGSGAQSGAPDHRPAERLGVVGGNDSAGEGDVGEVLAVGMAVRIR